MPTYDYQCQSCDHEWELFQAITAKPVRKCPECGKLQLRRLFGTGAAVVFKGSGFYETDYRSESYRKGAEKDKKAKEKGKEDGTKKKSSGGGEKSSGSKSKPKEP